jgi:aconitate hydratase
VVASVLSGNRNFEAGYSRKSGELPASPPLVVAYALAGTDHPRNITTDPLGEDQAGKPVYLKDIWPTEQEVQAAMTKAVTQEMFLRSYAEVFTGDERWRGLAVPKGSRFAWEADSTYIRKPTFLDGMTMDPPAPSDIHSARVLAVLGDSVTTTTSRRPDRSRPTARQGKYLIEKGVKPADFNSYGARRGNHEVMMRGTFANIRLRNQMAPGTEGGWTALPAERRPDDDLRRLRAVPGSRRTAAVLAGKEYGSGSSRDWAAKGTFLLGVKAVVAEVVRAHPPQQPREHGRAASSSSRRGRTRVAGADGHESYDLVGVANT